MLKLKQSVLERLSSSDKILLGQHASYNAGNFAAGYADHIQKLYEDTGQWPAILGATFGLGDSDAQRQTMVQSLVRYWHAGGSITLDWHADNPWSGGNCWDLSARRMGELLDTQMWIAELDRIATSLLELQKMGVIVLWRPFHEMTFKKAFWWGAVGWDSGNQKQIVADFIAAWRHMHEYFANKGLENLLWIYCAGDNDRWVAADTFYPGDEYVDFVGWDAYNIELADRPWGDPYNRLHSLGKPLCWPEFGPATRDGSFDNRRFLDIFAEYPKIKWVQFWHSWQSAGENKSHVAMVDHENARDLMRGIIGRDALWQPIHNIRRISSRRGRTAIEQDDGTIISSEIADSDNESRGRIEVAAGKRLPNLAIAERTLRITNG